MPGRTCTARYSLWLSSVPSRPPDPRPGRPGRPASSLQANTSRGPLGRRDRFTEWHTQKTEKRRGKHRNKLKRKLKTGIKGKKMMSSEGVVCLARLRRHDYRPRGCSATAGGGVSTIWTSDNELILRTYMVIPTSTGVPVSRHTSRSPCEWAVSSASERYRALARQLAGIRVGIQWRISNSSNSR